MKKIFSLLLMISICQIMYSQNVGINNPNPHAPLQFDSQAAERKIVLYEGGNNDHEFFGFGVSPYGELKYHTNYNDHVFESALSDSSSLELMRITGYGYVGIGTLPNNRLDIHYGSPRSGDHAFNRPLYVTGDIEEGDGIEFRHSNGTQGIGFGYNTIYATGSDVNQPLKFASRGYAPLIFKTNSFERMTISEDGNVGIGVAPLNKLDIAAGTTRTGTHPATMAAYITANLTAAGNGFEIRHYDGSEGIGLGSNTMYAAGSNANQNLNIAAKGATGNVALKTNTQDRLVVTGSGNVGINTSSMLNRLDINGGPTTRSGTHATGLAMYVTGNFSAASNGVEFRTNDATQGIGFGYNTIYAGGTNANQDLNLAAKGATGNISLSTNGSEKLKITGTGNFGFSVTAPANKLDIATTPRTGIHGSGKALYVTGDGEFRGSDGTTGLGIGSNNIFATGSNLDVDLLLASKGFGNLSFSTNGTERMKIAGNGFTGFKVPTPQNVLDVSDGTPRTGLHSANLALYVTGWGAFSTANGEQGLGIIGNQIYAEGSLTNVPLIFYAKGTTGDLQFITNGAMRMRITGAGNVGIGTVSPNAPLQFSITPQNRKIVLKESFDDDNQFFGFGYNANVLRYQTDQSTSDHVFYSAIDQTSSKELMRIKGNGKVGIGTSTPNAPLQFASLAENRKIVLLEGANNDHQFIGLGQNTTSMRYQVDATTSNHIFYAGTSATTSAELMRIEGTGDVGIGIATPANKLDIAAAARTNTHNTGQALYVTGGGEFRSSDATTGLGIGSNNIFATGSNASVDLSLAAKGVSGNLSLSTNGTEKMKISAAGNLGLGVTAPANKLDVHNGTARTGTHNTGQALYVTGGGEFRSADATTGLGIGSNNIFATGSNASVDLSVAAKGATGNIVFNTNAAEKMRITASGKVGIGTTAPNAPLQFASTAENRKIVLFEAANNDHQFIGFGVDGSGALRYQTATSVNDHIFYTATSPTTSTELMRITGTGMVGIGQPTPHAELQFSNNITSKKVALYEYANNSSEFSGFGLDGDGSMRYEVPTENAEHVFYSGAGPNGFIELMRLGSFNGLTIQKPTTINSTLTTTGNVTVQGTLTANAGIVTEAFAAATLLNGFTNYGNGYATAAYYKDGMGMVHLRGLALLNTNQNGLVMFTLPAGYRPSTSGTLLFSTIANTGAARIDIQTTGNVVVMGPSNGWISLDGIMFRAD